MTINTERLKTDAAYWDEVAPDWAEKVFILKERDTVLKPRFARANEYMIPYPCIEIGEIPRPTKPAAPEWDGEGLPPVGIKVEYDTGFQNWCPATVIAKGHDHSEDVAVIQTTNRMFIVDAGDRIRPIRTKDQREREELVSIINHHPIYKEAVHRLADDILSRYNLEPKP